MIGLPDDGESLAAFIAREGQYPEPPSDRSRYQWIEAGLRARREISGIEQMTGRAETATGPALADWFVRRLDLWFRAACLPPEQLAVINLLFITLTPCAGSGRFAGYGIKRAPCPLCPERKRYDNQERFHEYRVDRAGLLVPHHRESTIKDVAAVLHTNPRTIAEWKRAAFQAIEAYIWPPAPGGADVE